MSLAHHIDLDFLHEAFRRTRKDGTTGVDGRTAEEYAVHVPGTRFLSLEEAKKLYQKGDGLDSLYGSTKTADDFNVANQVYKTPQNIDEYIYGDILSSM